MPAIDVSDIRNVALFSHSGTGKTSLIEAMLMATGSIPRLGNVEDGNTTSDYEPEEIKRKSSIQASVAPVNLSGKKLNFIDAPGYPDFVGEAISALSAGDAVLLLVAAQASVEVGTELAWKMCETRALPRMIFVNKMDREPIVSRSGEPGGPQTLTVSGKLNTSNDGNVTIDINQKTSETNRNARLQDRAVRLNEKAKNIANRGNSSYKQNFFPRSYNATN